MLCSHMTDAQQSLKEHQVILKQQLAELKSQEEETTQLMVEKSERGNEPHKTYVDVLNGSCA